MSARFSILVAESEEFARRRLCRAIERMPDLEIVGSAGSVEDARQLLDATRPDLLLLDIALAACLAGLHARPAIVVAGAETRDSLDAWSIGAADFLLRPVAAVPLRAAIERAQLALANAEAASRLSELETLVVQLRREADARAGRRYVSEFWARSRGQYVRVRASEIDWIEAERDYVRLHAAGASWLHHESLGALEERLDPAAFRRVHRSAIVRWDRIREVRRSAGGLVVVTGSGVETRVGRTFAQGLLETLAPRWPGERRLAAL